MSPPIEMNAMETQFKEIVTERAPGANFDLCLTCGTCTAGCPASEQFEMDPRKLIRMLVLGMDDEIRKTPWAWVCTMCGRCTKACPMAVDIPKLVYNMRAGWPREKRPKGILDSCDRHIRAGNAMGVPKEDFVWTVEDVAAEIRDTQPVFKDMQVTVDRKGAFMAINQNSREPVTEPDELAPLWKILHLADVDWTYPSVMWAGENYCMFLADDEGWRYILEEFVDHIDNRLGCKMVVNTECGHSFYAIYEGLRKYNIPHNFEYTSIVQLYARWIREGRLTVNSDWNKEMKIRFTVQDPCNIVRKSLGREMAEDLRFVVKTLVGEENFTDTVPNGINNYCCGGGGGALQAGFTEQRRAYGKIKFDQIAATGAAYVVVPCHNCHAQLEDIGHHFGGNYNVVHIWTIMCLALGVLGENERTYLGDDLKDFGL